MKHVRGYKSALSGNFYPYEPGKIKYQCDKTGENLDVVYDYDYIKKHFNKEDLKNNRDYSIWRYAPILPVKTLDHIPPLQIGWTPLYRSRKLAKNIGLDNLYFKDDGRNPSASFKDRASAVALVRAIEDGAQIVTGASTGNAGSSMACLCASVGMPAVIFVPENAPVAKIAQLLVFGAKVFAVRGTYDDAFDLCIKVSEEFGWINRNTGYNPFTREGKKTCAFEICEQLEWEAPNRVFVSVGDGNIISGLWKGFRDLFNLGFIDKIPKLYGVQSEKSNSVFLSVKVCKLDPDADIKICAVKATTIADSISVDIPRDGQMAVRAILETDGDAVQVSDEDILSAVKLLGKNEGIFAEPAGATAYAGVRKLALMGDLPEDETIVAVVTGNGLKDVASALKVAGEPIKIDPDLDEVKRYIDRG